MAQSHPASDPRSPHTPETGGLLGTGPWLVSALLTSLLAGCGSTPGSLSGGAKTAGKLMVPHTARDEKAGDDYHGTWVADPYRWLEDQDGTDTAAWTSEQNRWTQAFLSGISKRDAIRTRLAQLWNYERFSPPSKSGDHW